MTSRDIGDIIASYLSSDDPVPSEDENFVGDGEFRAIGGEFLRYFATIGGLQPTDTILEIGCGLGRMALPIKRYLTSEGRYHGMDIVKTGVDWCTQHVQSDDESVIFSHADLYHPHYNPNGRTSALDYAFPADDGSIDFVILVSVFTHLTTAVTSHYFNQIRRVLAANGKCFATFFLIDDDTREVLCQERSRYAFDLTGNGPSYLGDGGALLGSVAVDAGWLSEDAARAGLEMRVPPTKGFWASDDPAKGTSFQDIVVFQPRS